MGGVGGKGVGRRRGTLRTAVALALAGHRSIGGSEGGSDSSRAGKPATPAPAPFPLPSTGADSQPAPPLALTLRPAPRPLRLAPSHLASVPPTARFDKFGQQTATAEGLLTLTDKKMWVGTHPWCRRQP